jgi:type I restriction enzyme R subunit
MDAEALLDRLTAMTAAAAGDFFGARPALVELLDGSLTGDGRRLLVSDHDDEMVRVERGYGAKHERPEDYLESFGRFLHDNANRIPALVVVTQRPHELTRRQLKELKLALDAAGYGELHLRTAWREWKNEDIAASIIGFIRQRALGEPLRPYAERVDAALQRILVSDNWTRPQRTWLERIGKQMKVEEIVDREALDQGEFKHRGGGFQRLDKVFDGHVDEVLAQLHDAVWRESA